MSTSGALLLGALEGARERGCTLFAVESHPRRGSAGGPDQILECDRGTLGCRIANIGSREQQQRARSRCRAARLREGAGNGLARSRRDLEQSLLVRERQRNGAAVTVRTRPGIDEILGARPRERELLVGPAR